MTIPLALLYLTLKLLLQVRCQAGLESFGRRRRSITSNDTSEPILHQFSMTIPSPTLATTSHAPTNSTIHQNMQPYNLFPHQQPVTPKPTSSDTQGTFAYRNRSTSQTISQSQ